MEITEVRDYLAAHRELRYKSEGLSVSDFARELSKSRRRAQIFVQEEVRAGRLKLNGKRAIRGSDDRVQYEPVYILVPHTIPDETIQTSPESGNPVHN